MRCLAASIHRKSEGGDAPISTLHEESVTPLKSPQRYRPISSPVRRSGRSAKNREPAWTEPILP
jgi:hypothetical protein